MDEASQSTFVFSYDRLWGALPVGQEFTPSLPWLDFVDLKFAREYPTVVEVHIREGTITGAVVAVSAPEASAVYPNVITRFTFSNAVPLVPGAQYVLEVAHAESPADVAAAGYLARVPSNAYSSGRAIWGGLPIENEDLDFALGVLVPEIVVPSALGYYEDQGALLLAPEATFANGYIDYTNGRNLTVTMRVFSGNAASLGILWISNDSPGTNQPLYLAGGYAGTITISPGRLTIEARFDTNCAPTMIEELIRRLYYVNPSQRPDIFPDTVSIRIDDGRASTELRFSIDFHNINDPPTRAAIHLRTPVLELPGSELPVIIARRGNVAQVWLDGSGSEDVDTSLLFYRWRITGVRASLTGSSVQRNLRIGRKQVRLTVSDGAYSVSATNGFEVISAQTAVRRLNSEVSASAEAQSAGLPRLLRRAAAAYALGRYARAIELLEQFDTRVSETIEPTNPDLGYRWRIAAYYIGTATSP